MYIAYHPLYNHPVPENHLLNHTKHMKKEGEYEHYHHLHLTGFDHSLIKIIEK